MKKTTIQIKHFFGGVYMYLGLLFAMLGVIFLIFDLRVSIALLFISILVFSTVYKLAIVKEKGYYQDYLWLLGIKIGRKRSFKSLDSLILNKFKYKQKLNSRGSSTVIEYDLYKGFIVFDGDNKVFIGESKKRSKIDKRIHELKDAYQLEVIDKSGE